MSRSRQRRSFRSYEEEEIAEWKPRTRVGRLVQEGRISNLEEIFIYGMKIREPQIANMLVPNLQEEVVNVSLVQKQTDAGEKSRFKAIVAVGNQNGYLGLGTGKADQVRNAIKKASDNARIKMTIIRRGCGSWECECGQPHSMPFETQGKRGSVSVNLIPGPRGLGLVASQEAKMILRLGGIKDCWTKSRGSTRTIPSFAYAVFDALAKTYDVVVPKDWV